MKPSVLTAQAHGLGAEPVDETDQFLIDLAQHHLDDVERRFVGHAHARLPADRDAHRLQQLVDPPPAAVHDDRIHADEPQQRDIAREAFLEHRIRHRATPEADDQRRRVERPDERQGFGEDPGLLWRCDGNGGHGRCDSMRRGSR